MRQRTRLRPRLFALLLVIPLVLGACSGSFNNGGATDSGSPTSEDGLDSGLGANYYTPRQMRVAYGVESLYQQGFRGKGQTVVVIDSFGSPTLQQDLDTFSDKFSLPHTTVKVLAPLGTKNYNPLDKDMYGWGAETTEDVQIIHAMAPEASIVVLTSPVSETEGVAGLPEFRQLEQYAIDNHLGTVVSQSYGASELSLNDAAGKAEIAKWNDLYQQATLNSKITFIASSGDGGATDYANAQDAANGQLANVATTSFPADSPWVTTIGGTILTMDAGTVGGEIAWPDSGGGFSRFTAEPSYQQALPTSAQTQLAGRRGVPDVSSSADVDKGMAMYYKGRWLIANGTSAGSPLWSALVAIGSQMAGRPLGFITPALYKIGTSDKAARDFRDITEGNNSQPDAGVEGFPAVTGWDPVTGFGSPVADKLLPDLIALTA